MTASWDRHADETEEWYDRFRLYLYMGPDRTIAAAHGLATRLAQEAARPQHCGSRHPSLPYRTSVGTGLRSLGSWRRAAQRQQWQARAAEFDAELCRKALASDERLLMVAELLHQVYEVLRHADMPTLSKEEARQLLPTFRLFFRDLLQFHQTAAAQLLAAKEGKSRRGSSGEQKEAGAELRADDLVKFLTEAGGWQTLLAEIARVTDVPTAQDGSVGDDNSASSGTSHNVIDDGVTGEEEVAAWQSLRDVLADFYPDEASARRMAAQAHLDNARIRFAARAVDTWHAILTEAAHAGLLEQVIAVVQQEYGANRKLTQAIQLYRQARSQGKTQGQIRGQPRGGKRRA